MSKMTLDDVNVLLTKKLYKVSSEVLYAAADIKYAEWLAFARTFGDRASATLAIYTDYRILANAAVRKAQRELN